MANRIVAFVAALLAMAGCRSPVEEFPEAIPGIDPNDVALTRELYELDSQINELEAWLARYPAHFESNEERAAVQLRWALTLKRASVLMNVDLENPELYARVGNLYRQGHNLDVPQAANSAFSTLSRCVELSRDHVDCHYYLARLFLASLPRFADDAERLLLRARSLIAPTTRAEFEETLARIYLAQGRRSASLRQIDRYLDLRPADLEAQRFRNALLNELDADRQRQ